MNIGRAKRRSAGRRKGRAVEHRWQVKNEMRGADEWVDAEPPVDKKLLDLAAQVIELEQRVKYWQDERGKFMDDAWKATGAKGDYPYGGVILMEIEGHAKERAIFQTLTPAEFTALSLARDLPHSGIHDASAFHRAPGGVRTHTLKTLLERQLIEANPYKPGYYRLSGTGKLLMGEPQKDEPIANDVSSSI